MLHKKVEELLSRLSEEDADIVRNIFAVTEQARIHVESGSGSYALMRAITKAYEPEKINLHQWTR